MDIRALAIPDVKIITPRRVGDDRGWVLRDLEPRGPGGARDRHQFPPKEPVAVASGRHDPRAAFQTPPRAQDKLVRVVQGRIWDVAVDIRKNSSIYGRWVAEEISAEAGNQILVPKGFAHGFCTLEPDTQVVYLVSDLYSGADDAGIVWNDPDLRVEWPTQTPILSEKDRAAPRLAEIDPPF